MKKILLLFIFLLLNFFTLNAQSYNLRIYNYDLDTWTKRGRCGTNEVKINIIFEGGEHMNIYYDGSPRKKKVKELLNSTFNKKISKIEFYAFIHGHARLDIGSSCNGKSSKVDIIESIPYSGCEPNGIIRGHNDRGSAEISASFNYQVNPIINISSVDPRYSSIGYNDTKEISVTSDSKGFSSETYNWEYQVVNSKLGETLSDSNWNSMPSNLNFSEKIVFTPSSFLHINSIGKRIYFRIKACNKPSNYIWFDLLTSAPHITSHLPNETKCFNTRDGELTLHFDRKLDKGETLSLSLKNKLTETVVVNKDITSYLHSGTSYTLENLPPGEYSLNVHGTYNGNSTYTDGEKHSIDFEIEKATPVSFQLSSKTDVYCFNGNDGVINIEAKGGTGKYQYLITKDGKNYLDWTDFNNANKTSINALSKGIYKIKVRDTYECVAKEPNDSSLEKEIEITISQPNDPIRLIDKEIEIVQPTGYGLSNGYISVMVQGGTPKSDGSYHYEWRKDSPTGTLITTGITTRVSNDSYTIKISNLTAGKYYLTVKDKNYNAATAKLGNCGIVSKEFEVTQPDPLKAEIEILQDISCNISNEYPFKLDLNQNGIPDNAEDGKIEAKVTGGVGTYSYQWQKLDNGIFIDISGATAPVLKNIKAGTYKILVIDKNKNKVEEKIVTTYPPKFELSMFANSISCNNESSGRVSVKATGGTGAYSYEWNTMDATSEVTGLRAGNYFVLVTDAKNCKIKGAAEVTQPDQIVITDEEVRNPICHNASNGSIKIKISGGTKPYKISWSNGVTTEENSNLSAGNYVLTVTDAKGCQEIKEYKLTNPEPLRVHIGEDVTLCAGDTQRYDATIDDKGASYLWRNEKGEIISKLPTIELSDAGVYTVTVTDSKGCIGTDRVVIKKSNEILEPKFMLTTHAYTESTVVLVNTSPKMPETVEWLIPDNSAVSVIEKNEEYLELKFSNTGSYRIGLKGMQGQCKKTFYKEVVVEENLSGVDLSSDKISNITEFNVAPNPNDGNFKVIVKLEKENTINLRIINMLTQQAYPVITKPKSTYFLVPYHVTLSTGVYFVILETGNESMVKKMIIK
ncbi:T9SS C-terminal target domain-containing protein [Ornithobacterium rhinotracheale]|uniref:T9SS type A sorting domain-containing protein n=1 Tax=Ornithobacterium rhinotracheale TaxID=28251 RepID=UPI00129CC861|nr:T9SS type A sorting domain-containing protein [Ornithobacterium rhinotracheale]MRJ09371.1 T9SS C-terminal target domain-containing protein [Ornithobacterium rhinotracheale]UOH78904.1 T9SS type A sorting domain-containing protein [Ornithobacterium rhinotracheale]